MRLATGLLTPTEGRVGVTDDAPKDLASLVADMDGDAWEIRGRLDIDDSWPERWHSLSNGERKLLDGLCRQCAFVDPSVTMRPGGYEKGVEQGQLERETALRERETATRELKKVEREVVRRREEASGSHEKRSKKNLGKGDNDEQFKCNLARATGKDARQVGC